MGLERHHGKGADELMMSTDPRATRDNFARDMQWGQGIQLLEDLDAEALDAVRNPGGISTRPPTPLVVKAGEQLRAAVRLSSDSVVLQFGVRRAACDGARDIKNKVRASIVYP